MTFCLMAISTSNFYPRPPRGGRHSEMRNAGRGERISIHALREEGDSSGSSDTISVELFLSTPSARRATKSAIRFSWVISHFYPRPPRGGRLLRRQSERRCQADFYPRPPRGGRLELYRIMTTKLGISIHALREEGDFRISTSGRGALLISIHALREEGDAEPQEGAEDADYFYPRPPRGGRHLAGFLADFAAKFLSTPSARRATGAARHPATVPTYFYPRPPRGGRLGVQKVAVGHGGISIHALREEGDGA